MRELKDIGYIIVGTVCIVIAAVSIVFISYPASLVARYHQWLWERRPWKDAGKNVDPGW